MAMRFLNITKIVSIVAAILTMPLLFIGIGLAIVPPLLFYVLAINRVTNPKPMSDAIKIAGFNAQNIASIATIGAGFGYFVGLYTIGSLGNLDTTRRPSDNYIAAAASICVLFIVSVLFAINRKPKLEPTP